MNLGFLNESAVQVILRFLKSGPVENQVSGAMFDEIAQIEEHHLVGQPLGLTKTVGH